MGLDKTKEMDYDFGQPVAQKAERGWLSQTRKPSDSIAAEQMKLRRLKKNA